MGGTALSFDELSVNVQTLLILIDNADALTFDERMALLQFLHVGSQERIEAALNAALEASMIAPKGARA